MEFGCVLISGPDDPPHVLIMRIDDVGPGPKLLLEVMSPRTGHASTVLDDVRNRMRSSSVSRGKVFSLSQPYDHYEHSVGASFMRRPSIDRTGIVLPPGVLERIERRTIGFDAVADDLVARGQARKRGLLLYGPPGTGKTLTARYLIGRMTDRTTIVLTGIGLGAIGAAANLARCLQPALLTTNRADLLEPALAARDGSIWPSSSPLPAWPSSRRLLELYTSNVDMGHADTAAVIDRIVGTPASFVRELVRTAVLAAVEADSTTVEQTHLGAAVAELLDTGPVTRGSTASVSVSVSTRRRTPTTSDLHAGIPPVRRLTRARALCQARRSSIARSTRSGDTR